MSDEIIHLGTVPPGFVAGDCFEGVLDEFGVFVGSKVDQPARLDHDGLSATVIDVGPEAGAVTLRLEAEMNEAYRRTGATTRAELDELCRRLDEEWA